MSRPGSGKPAPAAQPEHSPTDAEDGSPGLSGQSLSGQSHPDPSQADASQAGQPQAAAASSHASAELARAIAAQLEDDKAEDILEIDLAGKSSMADTMIVASGRSQRHVSALADHVARKLKNEGAQSVRVEGLPNADWVLIDAGDVIVHIFRPEVRQFYNLERIWGGETPASAQAANVQAMDRPS